LFFRKNQEILKTRRDGLLKRLHDKEFIDSLSLLLALDEPLPGEPKSLPSKTFHLTDYFFMTKRGRMIRTTIDPVLQDRATEIINATRKVFQKITYLIRHA